MAWKVELAHSAERELDKLDSQVAKRILTFLYERVSKLDNPRNIGESLKGPTLAGLWRYRVGDYRIFCRIEDEKVCVVVVEVGHRREIYKG